MNPNSLVLKMKTRIYTAVAALLTLFLAACDGGITGTGGINDPILENPPIGAEIDPEAPIAELDIPPQESDSSFNNATDVSERDDAIFKLINGVVGLGPVNARLQDGMGDAIFETAGLAFGEGGATYVSLPADTLQLDVIPAADFAANPPVQQIVGINPLTLGIGSASTAILRGSLDETLEAPLQIFSISNILSTNNTATIRIRIIHAAPAFDAAGPVDIFISPADNAQPTAGFPTFGEASYEAGDIGFIEVATGSYVLTATDVNGQTQRIPTIDPITPASASSTTIVILDDPDGVPGVDVNLVIINDGDRTGLE